MYAIFGSHFFIGGIATDVGPKDEEDTSINDCPSSIAFVSIDGEKKIFDVKESMDGLIKYSLGTFELDDFLKAETKATSIDNAEYDLSSNACVHYAQGILRFLETKELADFLVTNIVGSDEFIEMARKKAGGLRAIASLAIGGKGALWYYVKDVVTSQLDIM